MIKFVPFEKMGKKQKRALNLKKRRDWGGVNPVTRPVDPDPKRYSRKTKHKKRDFETE